MVAKRSWTTRDSSRRVDTAPVRVDSDEATTAAEHILELVTISAQDRRTRGHVQRVLAFTELLGRELRLPDDDRARLRWSALLHIVGHQDPREAETSTAPLASWLGPWGRTIVEHGERFDGGGRPFGLAGQEISTGSRILAVADGFDAMTSSGRHRGPMSTKAARLQLAAGAGILFDPVMVRAFLAVPVRRLLTVAPHTWSALLLLGTCVPEAPE